MNRIQNFVVECDSLEHLTQRLFIRSVWCCCDTKHAQVRVRLVIVDDCTIGIRSAMMGFIDYEQPKVIRIEPRHAFLCGAGILGLHGRNNDFWQLPKICGGGEIGHFDFAVKPGERLDLLASLKNQLFAMGQNDGALGMKSPDDIGNDDGFTAASGDHD